jgi:hypothetical protein
MNNIFDTVLDEFGSISSNSGKGFIHHHGHSLYKPKQKQQLHQQQQQLLDVRTSKRRNK